MQRGFLDLVAFIDWYSRRVLAWRVSNTMDVGFCLEALEEALRRFGPSEIFNTDQGSQFTSEAFTSVLLAAAIAINMTRKRVPRRGRALDNGFRPRTKSLNPALATGPVFGVHFSSPDRDAQRARLATSHGIGFRIGQTARVLGETEGVI